MITDRDTGRSKGFGFVEMDTDAQAEAAIQGLNDQEHDWCRLTVNEAKPRVARTSGGGFGGAAVEVGGYGGGGSAILMPSPPIGGFRGNRTPRPLDPPCAARHICSLL